METLAELEKYLEDNCYSFIELSIGKHHACEGVILEENGGKFNYAYSERGNYRVIKSFETERELVEYALNKITEDDWANAHIVASTFEFSEILEAQGELIAMKIHYKRNDVPNYKDGKTAYRLFVFGKDIQKLDIFRQKHLHYLR